MDIVSYNRSAWDHYVDKKDRWTVPITKEELEKAKAGDWKVVLTPNKAVPHHWFPALRGLKILGLASGGGQQGPILATLGAAVTIFDNSEKQLQQDKTLSDQYGLGITCIQGDMRDLSVFEDRSFDLIFNPCSILFVDDVKPVWKECYRVLKPGGILTRIMHVSSNINRDIKFYTLVIQSLISRVNPRNTSMPKAQKWA